MVLIGAPARFERTLGDLPPDVTLRTGNRRARDLSLWFVRRRRELDRGMPRMARSIGETRLWIIWPKKTSPLASDVTQVEVRAAGLAAGLVDFKVCAVDADWSGLAFVRRKIKK